MRKLAGIIAGTLLMLSAAHAEERSAELQVEGMTCAACAATVQNTCMGVGGVKQADVNLAAGKVALRYDDAQTQPGAVAQSVSSMGYKATAAKES